MATNCSSHPSNKATSLCETCKKKICLDCCKHEEHTKIPIENVSKAIEDLASEQYSIVNAIKSLEKDVKTGMELVIEEVQRNGNDIVQKLKDVRQNEAETMLAMENVFNGKGDSMEVKYLKAKDLKSSKSKYACSKRQVFVSSHYYLHSIPKIIGRLEWVDEDQELVELCSFKTLNNRFIRSICPVESSKAWILHQQDSKIHLVDYNGQIFETRNLGESVEEFCLSATGDVIYTTWNDCKLKKLTKDGRSLSLHEFDPAYTTRGLCFKGEDVIVCLCSKNRLKPNRLAKMSISDKTAREIDCPAKSGFFDPGRVSCTVSGVVAVVDWKHTDRFVKVVDRNGKCLSNWKGEMKSDSNITPFEPYDVSFCNINDEKRFLVTVKGSGWNKVCSVDVSGGDPKCIYTAEEQSCDGAIAMDRDGYIWIGDEKGRIHIMKVLAKT